MPVGLLSVGGRKAHMKDPAYATQVFSLDIFYIWRLDGDLLLFSYLAPGLPVSVIESLIFMILAMMCMQGVIEEAH